MKKIFFAIFVVGVAGLLNAQAHAQMMGGRASSTTNWDTVVAHTLEEEKEGKEVWEKLQGKEIICDDLTEDDFGVLSEYFMGQAKGKSHASMNAMLLQMYGEEGEEQVHIDLGKDLSGCNPSTENDSVGGGWMSMMGGWSSPVGFNQQSNYSMMGYGFPFLGGFGWIIMVLFWGLVIWGIIAVIKGGIGNSQTYRNDVREKSALDILKDRYAKGEIKKEEFEEKKRDLI